MSDRRRIEMLVLITRRGWTLRRVGKRYGVSRQRVEQIVRDDPLYRAWQKLKSKRVSMDLRTGRRVKLVAKDRAYFKAAGKFFSQIGDEDKNGCLPWTGTLNPNGYGSFLSPVLQREFNMGSSQWTHRYAWCLANGPIPERSSHLEGQILHTCNTRNCVSPDHLYLGTPADNMRDRDKDGNTVRGEKQWKSRLTEEDVLGMRYLWDNGLAKQVELAEIYRTNPSNISYIVNRKAWKHLP